MNSNRYSITIGTRGSKLALVQTNFIRTELLKINTYLDIAVQIIKTTGDKVTGVPLPAIGEKGLFTKELNDAIFEGTIDCAVHSLKDLPTEKTKGITIGAITRREWRQDVLISPQCYTIELLPPKAIIATSSLRRKSLLLNHRPDFQFVDIRGNVDTRIRKVKESGYDAIILAEAGLKRLGLEKNITEVIPFEILLPAPAQGALGITVADDNDQLIQLLDSLKDHATVLETTAERSFLAHLEGGCHIPIGATAFVSGESLLLEGVLANLDGTKVIRKKINGKCTEAEVLGKLLAEEIRAEGGQKILDEINNGRK